MIEKRNVMCSMCKFEIDRRCQKKNVSVKPNKKRSCDHYEYDEDKANAVVSRRLNSSKPEITLRPNWYWDRNKRRNLQKRRIKGEMKGQIDPQIYEIAGDSAHPLTGDLSKFTSTVKE